MRVHLAAWDDGGDGVLRICRSIFVRARKATFTCELKPNTQNWNRLRAQWVSAAWKRAYRSAPFLCVAQTVVRKVATAAAGAATENRPIHHGTVNSGMKTAASVQAVGIGANGTGAGSFQQADSTRKALAV